MKKIDKLILKLEKKKEKNQNNEPRSKGYKDGDRN